MNQLIMKEVSKKYRKNEVLHSCSGVFIEGINALLGPNGAGKTTLMNILATAIERTCGSVLYNGEEILDMGESYRSMFSILFQHQPYFPNYQVGEYLYFYGVLKGIEKKFINEEIDRVLHLVNLHGLEKKKLKALSGGMRQRLFIAQTLMNQNKVIIMDEPSVGLDVKEREDFKGLIKEISKNTIVILSTHIISDVEDITDKLFLMNKGYIVYEEEPNKKNDETKGIRELYFQYVEKGGDEHAMVNI